MHGSSDDFVPSVLAAMEVPGFDARIVLPTGISPPQRDVRLSGGGHRRGGANGQMPTM
ncbi:MAG: hypothetical protein SV966_15985 [Actinomycetota bacterium]|nr:hypothetical protein [Actinomycetota bacterium]